MKNIFFVLAIFLAFESCKSEPATSSSHNEKTTIGHEVYKISGKTMGTTYNIVSDLSNLKSVKTKIDQLLVEINHDVSTYEEDSFISMFNKSKENVVLQNTKNADNEYPHFKKNFLIAKEVFDRSNGAFDPTVLPLVNYWGFGPNKKSPDEVDKVKLEALRADIGFDKLTQLIEVEKQYLVKQSPGVQLDFSAIAKGYAVDQVGSLLEENGSRNYLVEIGGEVKVKGENAKGKPWVIGINKPEINSKVNSVFKKANLTDVSMASSGNYRNYFKIGDKIYSHTINPTTGYPERNTLLSATIFAENCIHADAYATACMVLGVEESKKMIGKIPGVEAYLIYSDEKGGLAELKTKGASYYIAD